MSEIKPILRQMIDNNRPHWRPETIRGAHKLLDEYEEKAKTYTKLVSQISAVDAIVAINYDEDMTDTNLHLLMLGAEVKRFFESGEYDE